MTNETRTITFQPDHDVRSLLSKAINRKAGRGRRPRGLRTKLINEALRLHLETLRGKREAAA